MTREFRWKTPDGRRPSIYFMLTAYWRDGPVWVPFLFAIFFGLMLWKSPILAQTFGPDPDYTKNVFADGHFGERHTEKSLYKFTEIDGRIVYLSCWPRMRVNSCIDDMTSPSGVVRVEYAPMPPSFFPSESGVLIGLWRGRLTILDPIATRQHLTRHIDRFTPLNIFLIVLGGIPSIILGILFVSIICGMIEGVKRIFHAV